MSVDSHHLLPAPGSDSRSHKKRHVVIWISLLVLLALAVVLVVRYFEEEKKPAPPPTKVTLTIATAEKGDIGVYLDSIGTVTPVYTVAVTSQVTGWITAVHYTEGQLVNQGDPLIEIDSSPFTANLQQARGAYERDKAVLAQAEMDLDRYTQAWARNAIARQTKEDQEKIVQQDKGTVKNDRGLVEFDKIQVAFCHIKAPITGRMGLRLVDPGNLVQGSAGQTLAVITQLTPITVVFTIPEDNIGDVAARLRDKATLAVYARDRTNLAEIASGELLTIDNQIDTETGTVKARAVFDNKNGEFFPNQFVNIRLLVNTLQGVTLIPTSTIQQNGDASFVYVIRDNVAYSRSIKRGVTDGDVTEVEGIEPGEVVANSSFDKLQDKTAVIVAPGPATRTSGPATRSTTGPAARSTTGPATRSATSPAAARNRPATGTNGSSTP